MREAVEFNYEDLCKAIEAIPPYSSRAVPTEAQRKALLKYWNSGRNKKEVARMIGTSYDTARRWYAEAAGNDNR